MNLEPLLVLDVATLVSAALLSVTEDLDPIQYYILVGFGGLMMLVLLLASYSMLGRPQEYLNVQGELLVRPIHAEVERAILAARKQAVYEEALGRVRLQGAGIGATQGRAAQP